MAITPLLLPAHTGVADDPALSGRTANVRRGDANAFTLNLPQMSGFAVEEYFYGATGATGTAHSGFQLVAYGDGPGWGPDYTNYKGETEVSFYPKSGALGPTEGKYVIFAHGLGKDILELTLNGIFQQLDGARAASQPDINSR